MDEQEKRLEIKAIGPIAAKDYILAWLKSDNLFFYERYPKRRVNNIYFDTYDLYTYEENLSGISRRAKIRLRWYGDLLFPQIATLEYKIKRNRFGKKIKFPINFLDDPIALNELVNHINQSLPETDKELLNQYPYPVLLNTYVRHYFESRIVDLRVTVDEAYQVFDQRYDKFLNLTRDSKLLPQTLVVEFKFPKGSYDQVKHFLNRCPLRISRHSKYVNGVRSLYMY